MKNEDSTQKWLFLSNFGLKLLAFLFMTLDHVGLMLEYYYLSPGSPVVILLRGLGRLAMPLFAFIIYEGVTHTRSFKKYALRLGIMALFISGVYALLAYIPNPFFSQDFTQGGNIFIDLLLGAVGVYCLMQANWRIKMLALLPACYAILSFAITTFEYNTGTLVYWLPFYLRTQYGWFSVLLIMSFYLARLIKDFYLSVIARDMGVDVEVLKLSSFDMRATNLLNMSAVVVISLCLYALSWFGNMPFLPYQWLALFSGALLLCYSGKRGYNKPWFEYGAYLYYPLHLAIIALVFYLLTL